MAGFQRLPEVPCVTPPVYRTRPRLTLWFGHKLGTGGKMWFWKLLTVILVRGETEQAKSNRLDRLLPVARSAADAALREQATEKLEGLAKLAVAASVPAIGALFGIAKVLEEAARSDLQQAAYCFVAMGLAGGVAWLLSIWEPILRARVWGRLEEPDWPLYGEDEYRYCEAVSERVEAAHHCVRHALIWRSVRWLKAAALATCVVGFCAGLLLAAGSLR